MNKLLSLTTASIVALSFAVGAASAAVTVVTEGDGQNRKLVKDSVDLDDADNVGGGVDLDSINAGGVGAFDGDDVIEIHGRIVSSVDRFTYTFSFTEGFTVRFNFDGYTLADDTVVAPELSGLVGQDGRGGDPILTGPTKGVGFSLLSGGSTVVGPQVFTTNVTKDTTSSDYIFGAGPGTYTLVIDGAVPPSGDDNVDALYDLRIAAVPLPTGVLLLGLGLAGMAGAHRIQARRKTA